MKADELALARDILEHGGSLHYRYNERGVFQYFATDMHHKRIDYVLSKWQGYGWWDWGVTIRGGWLLDEGYYGLHKALNDNGTPMPIDLTQAVPICPLCGQRTTLESESFHNPWRRVERSICPTGDWAGPDRVIPMFYPTSAGLLDRVNELVKA